MAESFSPSLQLTNPNREIYNTNYSQGQLDRSPMTLYNLEMVKIRQALLESYGRNKDVLDLCCGTGTYLLPNLSLFQSVTGVDFSETLLSKCKERFPIAHSPAPRLLLADARELPIASGSLDFVYSFASLYYVPEVGKVFSEVFRVLRRGGIAALELGNQCSLNTLFSYLWHREAGWAKPFHISLGKLKEYIKEFELIDWRCFQFLPLYRPPTPLLFLYPFTAGHLHWILERKVRGKMLDEILSTSVFKPLAFRHLVILKKPC